MWTLFAQGARALRFNEKLFYIKLYTKLYTPNLYHTKIQTSSPLIAYLISFSLIPPFSRPLPAALVWIPSNWYQVYLPNETVYKISFSKTSLLFRRKVCSGNVSEFLDFKWFFLKKLETLKVLFRSEHLSGELFWVSKYFRPNLSTPFVSSSNSATSRAG